MRKRHAPPSPPATRTSAMLKRAGSLATQKFSSGGRAKEGHYKQRPITLPPVKSLEDHKPRGRS